MAKKVFQLHDRFHEEVLFNVLIEEEDTDNLWNFWTQWHQVHNSRSEESKDIYAFIDEAREGGVTSIEEVEIDFIQI